jgi:hypothetical protein
MDVFDLAVRIDYLNYDKEPNVFAELDTYIDLSVS